MSQKLELCVRAAKASDRRKLADLIHFEPYVHRHLDWRPPLDWLDNKPFLLAEQSGKPVATLACPPDPPRIAWVRLFGVSREIRVLDAWNVLWAEAYAQLSREDNNLCSLAGRNAGKLFMTLNEYEESINVLTDLRHKLPQDKDIDETIYLIAESEEKLNNLNTALSLYQELLTNYPNSLYVQKAREKARIINQKINEDQT